jgi:D-alanyl-lipoteichoic acid acyltransferase DltB (MBOAT superfamily)
MLFPTVTFAVFFAVVLAAAWALRPHPRIWRLFLVAASWVFYAWWDARFVALLAAAIAANHVFAAGIAAGGRRAKVWLAAGVAANLAVLGFFKYYGFFVDGLLDALSAVGLAPSPPLLQVALPVGISFFTFEAIAYLMELQRGVVERLPLLDLATWLSFFPTLVSGPITRPSEFVPQLTDPTPADAVEMHRALWLIGRGLFKKVVVASFLAEAITDGIFATPGQYSGPEVLVGIYAYAAQLYVDFSGYTDMAIGLALLLGFRLPENFRAPYSATSVQDFWNRWHLTLSRWLRDFLLQPLTLRSRRTPAAAARNIVVVMLLAGLWHGAGWTFVVWGAIHGLALALERLHRERRRARLRAGDRLGSRPATPWRSVRARLLTFHVVCFAWIFFRADSLSGAGRVLARLTVIDPAPAVTPLLVLVLAAVLAAQHLPAGIGRRAAERVEALHPAAVAVAAGVGLLLVDALGPDGVPPFIYFRF